jgi:tetratricopeptide (TPR) repeat protein
MKPTPTAGGQPEAKERREPKQVLREYRGKLALWVANTVAATFFGLWLGDAASCLDHAKEKVEAAGESIGFVPYREECFLLPPVDDSAGDQSEVKRAEANIADAEQALDRCWIPCWISKDCRRLRREIKQTKASLALLGGDCRGALGTMESLRRDDGLSREAAITWAWAKVETDPSDSSYRQAIDALAKYPQDNACLATTRGSLLRRLALSKAKRDDGLLREALAEHNKALTLNARSALVDYNRAVVLLDLGEAEAAQAALDSAKDHLGGRPDPYWHYAQAKVYELSGDNPRMLDELTVAVESGYPDAEFRLARGWTWLRLGRFQEAQRDFRRAQEMNVRAETSCRRSSQTDLYAEVMWGLSWVQYKEHGPRAVDVESLRLALGRVTDPQLQHDIAADLAEFSRRRTAASP